MPVRTFTVDLHVLAQLAGHARRGTIGVTYTARAEAFGDSPVGIGHIGTRIAVAEADGALAGYALIRWPSKLASKSDAARPLELHQLYCAASATGRGIGAALMEWALEFAKEIGCEAVQLSVFSENYGAQRFYARYGFSKIADIEFWVGEQCDHEFLFERRL